MTKKKIKCLCCDGRGWTWYSTDMTSQELVWEPEYIIESCNACKGNGVLEVEDPDGLVKPEQEVK